MSGTTGALVDSKGSLATFTVLRPTQGRRGSYRLQATPSGGSGVLAALRITG